MRASEFANASDALAMWKIISDNTWAAIAQQAEAEAKRKAERAAARKSASKRGTGKRASKPLPPKRLPPPLQHVSAPVPKDAKSAASAETKPSNTQQQQPVQTPAALPSANTVQPQQPVQAIPVGAVASQASPNIANLASQTQFARSTKN